MKRRSPVLDVFVGSLWTNIRTGTQIVITHVRDDGAYVGYLVVPLGSGMMVRELLETDYVMASDVCRIEARAS